MNQITFDDYIRFMYERIELYGSIKANESRIENLKKVLKILGPDLEPAQVAEHINPDVETIEYYDAQMSKPKPEKKVRISKKENTIIMGYENQMAESEPKPAKRSRKGGKPCL